MKSTSLFNMRNRKFFTRKYEIYGVYNELDKIKVETRLKAVRGVSSAKISDALNEIEISFKERVETLSLNASLIAIGKYYLGDYFIMNGAPFYDEEE